MRTFITTIAICLTFACTPQQEYGENDPRESDAETIPSPARHIMLSDRQIRLANVSIQPVTATPIDQSRAINGRVVIDENNSRIISSRVAGRIEKLHVKETGKKVASGEALYTMYSEELLALQREYLLTKDRAGQSQHPAVEGAARKLKLYGLTDVQISRLNPDELLTEVTFVAPVSGVVTEIAAAEGQYVNEGTGLYRVEDMTTVWVEGELYPGEIADVEPGDRIRVSADGLGARGIDAAVTFVSPEFKNGTQIAILRASLQNTGNVLKPGQQVRIMLTRSESGAIIVPRDAVIRDQFGSHVYVQSGNNTFRPQIVTTGMENDFEIQIIQGLQQGDTVAVSGVYLLYSELILRHGPVQDAHLKMHH